MQVFFTTQWTEELIRATSVLNDVEKKVQLQRVTLANEVVTAGSCD